MLKPLLIIPSYLSSQQHANVLAKCVGTLRISVTDPDILIVDDCSPIAKIDEFYSDLEEWCDGEVSVFRKDENSGFSSSVNIGLARALSEGRDACLINADIEFVEKEWMVEAQKTEADIVGALLLYPNLLIQHAGIYFSKITRTFHHRFVGSPPNLPLAQIPVECPVTGALQYIRHSVLKDVGVYDEIFKLGFEDVDFMIRAIQAGHRSVYNPKVKAIHHESLFRKQKNDKLRRWEQESLVTLLRRYKDTDFSGVVPTMGSENGV